jgi:hypothetical protein
VRLPPIPISVMVLPPRTTIAQIPSRSDTRMIMREHEGEFWGKGARSGCTIFDVDSQ